MSARRQIDRRLRVLGDIGDVMSTMKNLALMEVHKLSRFALTQSQAVGTIEAAAVDLLGFCPELLVRPARTVLLLVGSERGFCGDFNEALVQELQARVAGSQGEPEAIIAVGCRLWDRLPARLGRVIKLEGASVGEDVGPMLTRVMRTLTDVQPHGRKALPWSLSVLYHDPTARKIALAEFAPFRPALQTRPPVGYPPLLNVSAAALLPLLAEQYLFAVLHGIAYDSLMAENSRRLQQMEDALDRVNERVEELKLRRNVLRQEEITEEIEVIMLSVDATRKGLDKSP